MKSKVICPVCTTESTSSPLKNWQYGKYAVTRYKCDHCHSKFNYYRSPEKTFTLPKSKQSK